MLLGTACPALAQPPLAGNYDGGQTEMAARLFLHPDGRFQYALSYGALDETAQGRWVEKAGHVVLTSDPRPKPPRFAVVSDQPASDGQIHVALQEPDLLQGSSLTLIVTYAGESAPAYLDADEDGRVPVPAGKTVTALVPDLPVYTIPVTPYALKPGGRRIVFHFEPNDFGVADFNNEQLAIDSGVLVMQRHDRMIRFQKADD